MSSNGRLRAVVGAAVVSVACGSTNPFANREFYVNPANQQEYDSSIATATGDVKTTLQAMRDVPSAYWIDVKEKIKGNTTHSLEGILQDAASKSPPQLVTVIWYDLPNRDCDAKASNGQICCTKNSDGTCDYDTTGDCAEGLQEYTSEYVDPFVAVLKEYSATVPIVVVLEPDSLPNLATNLADPHCGNPATQAAYKQGVKYAMDQLTTQVPEVSVYLDAAHGGWLGWSDNMDKFATLLQDMDLPMARIRGFATNTANYQSLGQQCPWEPDQGFRNGYCLNGKHASDPCCADPCSLLGQYDPANNELNYAQALVANMNAVFSIDAHVIIDTGRNGVPDERTDCANWCNPRNAGAGIASTAHTANTSLVDAYFWLKTPGESDGCSQTLPDGLPCKRYDSMCGSADSLGTQTGEPPAPEAGMWYDFQVKQLAANAHLSPAPTPPSPPSPTAPTAPTPTPPAPTAPTPTPPAPTAPAPTPPSGDLCCYGGATCAEATSCQGGWCGLSQANCEGNCAGMWCPSESSSSVVI
jgi:cellulose 1,4-beta-cellobiosidase